MNLSFRRVALAILLAGSLAASQAAAVNLVPNDSFETYTSCPTAFSQITLATPWSDATQGTSDYYNACASGAFVPDVPLNNFGNQAARTGVAYAGIVAWDGNSGYREYLEAPLSAPLVASVSYTVSFYVSLSDNSDTATDRLGAYLSVGPVGPVGTTTELSFTPQVESPANGFLADKTNWMLVSGTFTAAGGEDHIVIGNFHDNANTNTMNVGGLFAGGNYYYIDDVSVESPTQVDQPCCLPNMQCAVMLPAECLALGGTPQGPNVLCDSQTCVPLPAMKKTWGSVKILYR